MSGRVNRVFEEIREGKSMGAMEALVEGVKEAAAAYGRGVQEVASMGLDAMYSPGMKDFAAHGAHELASALFNGSGFILYPRTAPSREDQTVEAPAPEHDRGMGH